MALGTKLVRGGRFCGVVVAIFELAANAGNGLGPALAGWLKTAIPWPRNGVMAADAAGAAVLLTAAGSIVAMQAALVPLLCLRCQRRM
jgi:hypothetical protein